LQGRAGRRPLGNGKARSIMNYEFICSCLQLSPADWPPDHYTLLGLEPGESDIRRIEQHAQERMEKLRRYQLRHADQVTEAMNRLAQALVCLMDPTAKKAYDARLLNRPIRQPTRSSNFHGSRRTDQPSRAARARRSRSFSHWLLLAWIVWLSVGVAGFAAIVHYFPAIRESYRGVSAPD
jgi:hypothetical protein